MDAVESPLSDYPDDLSDRETVFHTPNTTPQRPKPRTPPSTPRRSSRKREPPVRYDPTPAPSSRRQTSAQSRQPSLIVRLRCRADKLRAINSKRRISASPKTPAKRARTGQTSPPSASSSATTVLDSPAASAANNPTQLTTGFEHQKAPHGVSWRQSLAPDLIESHQVTLDVSSQAPTEYFTAPLTHFAQPALDAIPVTTQASFSPTLNVETYQAESHGGVADPRFQHWRDVNIKSDGVLSPPSSSGSPTDINHSTLPPLFSGLAPSPPEWNGIFPEDAKLHSLALELLAGCSTVPKPAPSAAPEVWADTRMELCETLHYFRAWHGGCYSTGGLARGFMFDGDSHPRDFMDATAIISRAGGGRTRDKGTGEMKMEKDQLENANVHSLRNSMQQYNPVVIVTGAGNKYIPSQSPHTYCVLDYFKPTHIWWEKHQGKKILRFRFEKLNADKPSWWQPMNTKEAVELGSLSPPIVRTCESCRKQSQQVYLQGWVCLHPECLLFWKMQMVFGDPKDLDERKLIYDPRFLKQKVPWPNDEHVYSLTSNDAQLSGLSIAGEDCSQAFWLGRVCPNCGRCNSRLAWTGWECGNPECGSRKEPPHTVIPAAFLREPYFPLTTGYTMSRDTHLPLVGLTVSFAHGYRINKYTIPGIDGFVAHMIANRTVIEEPGGPDAMFEDLQKVDIGLRRRSLGNGQIKGDSFTRHFCVNYGMPYKFVAATSSASFEGAASPITDTRSRLNWAAKFLLAQQQGKAFEEVEEEWKKFEFNEVLALGYFEGQKINYHDDGEYGLGPTIATLSLGAPGTMRLRMKQRHHNGVTGSSVFDETPAIPGCLSYEARCAAQAELLQLRQVNKDTYRARLKELPKQLKLTSNGQAKNAITMAIAHGDIVVMHGAKLQKYYEHAVEHAGKLRFALTCRYIDPSSLMEKDRPTYQVLPDEGRYNGAILGRGVVAGKEDVLMGEGTGVAV